MSLCVVCSQPLPVSNAAVPSRGCFACVNAVLALLTEIETMAATLDSTPHPGADTGGPRRPFYGPRVPIDLTVAATLDIRTVPTDDDPVRSLLGTLHGINKAIREQRGERAPAVVLLNREIAYLRSRITWCATRDDFADTAADIRDLHRHVRMVARSDRPQPVGRCPAIVDRTRRCGGHLEVWPDDDEIRCPKCPARWHRGDYLELAERVGKVTTRAEMTRPQLAAYTGRSERVIREHVRPVRYETGGIAVYDAVDAVHRLAGIHTRRRRDTRSTVVDTNP